MGDNPLRATQSLLPPGPDAEAAHRWLRSSAQGTTMHRWTQEGATFPLTCPTLDQIEVSSTASSLESEKRSGFVGNFCSDKCRTPDVAACTSSTPSWVTRESSSALSSQLSQVTPPDEPKKLNSRTDEVLAINKITGAFVINLMQVWACDASGDKLNTTDPPPDCN